MLDDAEVSAVGGVEQGSETLMVAVVDPEGELLLVLLLAGPAIPIRLVVLAHLECNLPNEEFDDVDVSFEGQLVEDVVALGVDKFENVDVGLS